MRAFPVLPAFVLAASAVFAACTDSKEQAPQPEGLAPAAPPPAATQASPRDLSTLNLCETVRPEEVATAAGGKLATEPSWSGKACMYVVEVADGTESYVLSVYPASLAEALLQVQSPAEKGEKTAGPWDEGWLGPRAMGSGFTLLAVRRGDIAIEASGDRREVAVALGRLVGDRVK